MEMLSPVRALSSTFRLAHSISFPSAGIQSPASRITSSPIVTSLDGIWITLSSRTTLASGADNCFKLSSDCSAFTVCIVPRTAFIVITTKITIALSASPRIPDMTADTINIITRKSLNCSKNNCSTDFFPTVSISFRPYFAICSFTCDSVNGSRVPFTL